MKKLIQIFTIGIFLLCSKFSFGQNLIKAGPSLRYNVSFFDEEVYPAFGGEISYELSLAKKISANFSALFHISQHDNWQDENVTTTDILPGIQTEIRFYFKEKYKSGYFGIGGDTHFLISKNYFPPTPQDPNQTLANWEFNVGLTLGYSNIINQENLNFTTGSNLYINPFVYIGFNPSDQNEFELHARLGLSFGF